MDYQYSYSWLGVKLIISTFLIWDIRLAKYWLWRKIRELQGEEYI